MSRATVTKAPRRKRKRSWILSLAVLVFVVYVVVMLAQLHMELKDREAVLADMNAQIAARQRANEELQNKLDNRSIYLEEQARLRGLARPGELIFQEIPGVESTEG